MNYPHIPTAVFHGARAPRQPGQNAQVSQLISALRKGAQIGQGNQKRKSGQKQRNNNNNKSQQNKKGVRVKLNQTGPTGMRLFASRDGTTFTELNQANVKSTDVQNAACPLFYKTKSTQAFPSHVTQPPALTCLAKVGGLSLLGVSPDSLIKLGELLNLLPMVNYTLPNSSDSSVAVPTQSLFGAPNANYGIEDSKQQTAISPKVFVGFFDDMEATFTGKPRSEIIKNQPPRDQGDELVPLMARTQKKVKVISL